MYSSIISWLGHLSGICRGKHQKCSKNVSDVRLLFHALPTHMYGHFCEVVMPMHIMHMQITIRTWEIFGGAKFRQTNAYI